jgi:hypothetical protein
LSLVSSLISYLLGGSPKISSIISEIKSCGSPELSCIVGEKKIKNVVRQLYPPLQANYNYDYGGSPISGHSSRISFINAITVA